MQQVRTITTFLFAFFLIGSATLYANNGNGTDEKKDKTETTEASTPDPDQDTKKEQESNDNVAEAELAPEDSTTNSLNKLNFIFYFIYKNKYDSPAEVISRLFD